MRTASFGDFDDGFIIILHGTGFQRDVATNNQVEILNQDINSELKSRTTMSHEILFLCTGNYYRSRFAEMLFNALALKLGLNWKSDSRGIVTELGAKNIGPISPHVLRRLKLHDILTGADPRAPMQLEEADLAKADLIIALDAAEHLPLIKQRFSKWTDHILYWNVADLNLIGPDDALSIIENNVMALIQQLQSDKTP